MTSQPNPAQQVRRSIELLWGGGGRQGRGPRPSLSLRRIVEAAIAVADRDGVDGLSMRRVAAELGVGTMSLYRYVPGKAELLALMLDRVSEPGEELVGLAGAGWRAVLTATAQGSYRLYRRHPWLLQVNWTRPVIGPNTLAGIELVMRSLDRLGLTDQERISVMVLVDAYVTGLARQHIQHAAVSAETGLADEEFWAQQGPALSRAMESGDYPAMAALAEDAFSLGWDETFEFGLRRLLDGVGALIASRTSADAG
ncbi:MAG TPA: TetR/AcrR family transcriptional regulator [Pilimelia sp.]|nr:TetR/AcrR family transcriptional regulator [Pilimelia sp.]